MSKNQLIWTATIVVISLTVAAIVYLFHIGKEYLIGAVGFIAFGTGALLICIWHEFQWWKRYDWNKDQGVIVGYTESYSDGICYHEEVEFLHEAQPVRFVSDYGSSAKPEIGSTVYIVIDPSGENGEIYNATNRRLFTIVPALFALLFITLGINTQPEQAIPEAKTKCDQIEANKLSD